MTEQVKIGHEFHAKLSFYCRGKGLSMGDFVRMVCNKAMELDIMDGIKMAYKNPHRPSSFIIEPYDYSRDIFLLPMPENGTCGIEVEKPYSLLMALEEGSGLWRQSESPLVKAIAYISGSKDGIPMACAGPLAKITTYSLTVSLAANGQYYPACENSKNILTIMEITRACMKAKTQARESFSSIDIKMLHGSGWVIHYLKNNS